MKTYIHFIKKTALFTALLIVFNLSYGRHNVGEGLNHVDALYEQKLNLKKEFARALLKAMKESKMLRDVLKTEALRMFDKDYDVLYLLIKDKTLENSLSVEGLISKHILGGKETLDSLLSQIPALTILVPELPNESFSAELWDTENDIPAVAIPGTSGSVPFIRADGSEDVVPKKHIPGFPMLVIKDNERVIASKSNSRNSSRSIRAFNQSETRDVYNNGEIRLSFWDKAFDNSVKKRVPRAFSKSSSQSELSETYSTLRDAYDICKKASGNIWHRDYIYYDISPSNPSGSFNGKWEEHITSFSMKGDPTTAFNKIIDQDGDPKSFSGDYWTESAFDFKVIARINSKESGQEYTTTFSRRPIDLFEITYQESDDYYVFSIISLKTISLHLPLFKWNLENYSKEVKITIEEVDIKETFTRGETSTVGFASNFKKSNEIKRDIGNEYTRVDRDENSKTDYNKRTTGYRNEHYKKRHKQYKSGTEASAGFEIKGIFGARAKVTKERSEGIEEGSSTSYSAGSEVASTRGSNKYQEDSRKHVDNISEKVGGGIETSNDETKNLDYTITYSKGNDFLGERIVNFSDDILIGDVGDSYTVKEYSTGLYKFKIMPIKVH